MVYFMAEILDPDGRVERWRQYRDKGAIWATHPERERGRERCPVERNSRKTKCVG